VIPVLVEGDSDVAVARRLLDLVGLELGPVYGLRGKNLLDQRLDAYNQAARRRKWLVLRDLNGDARCAPELAGRLLPHPSRGMCFRVAVRALEAWLLADRANIARFLSVPIHRIPTDPDEVANPKLELVSIARRSRRVAIREDLVPAPTTSAQVGPGYTSRVIEFATDLWRPRTAASLSDSLARAIASLERWAVE